ncbi:hypothetical protein W97_02046 [Coniosporium apollinis CBS 100218]|uniref:Extracellular membrane protein CFEM domain-containing protein n=1 Tax=Coniosporium apollinis (strain CBS 100218) TaxID=1168221 RepID=R7YME4_CONA1|nr:uncharacterized protein W97_02046 [Coniosporium apollinis CBS 100218]EON62821.1 hypothetical protein W97_02046 [Coniosporium apollinis CBS 100218]
MRSSIAILLAAAGFAIAQTATGSAVSSIATSTTNGCLPGAETIVDACLASTQALADACVGNDWVCLCTQYQNVLTCYNNCPSLPNRATVQNQASLCQQCQRCNPFLHRLRFQLRSLHNGDLGDAGSVYKQQLGECFGGFG